MPANRISLFILLCFIVFITGCKKDEEEKPSDPDNKPPTVQLSISGYNNNFVQFDTVKLQATVADSDGVVNRVKFFEGENLLHEDHEVPFTYDWIVNDPGEYTLTAVAYDNDGDWGESMPRSIHVMSGTIPYAVIERPHQGEPIREGSSFVIETYGQDHDGEIVKMEVFLNDVLLSTHFSAYTLDTVWNIPLGSFNVKAIAYDDDGNFSEAEEVEAQVYPNKLPVVEINQNYAPEYYWTGDNVYIDVDVTDYDGLVERIELYANTMLVASDSGSYYYDIDWMGCESGTWDLQVRAYDDAGGVGYSNIITIEVKHRVAVDGEVACFEWGGSPDRAFALVRETNKLLIIDPQEKSVVKSIQFPYTQPRKMEYSVQDDKLYIVSSYSGKVSVFDVVTESFTHFTFSSTADGRDISISPEYRRIYVGASDGFYIMDMDNGTVLNEDHWKECWNVEVMHNQQKILVNYNYHSDCLQRFSVVNDVLDMEESYDGGGDDCDQMIVTPDDSKLIYPCTGYGYQITALDPVNLQDIIGIYEVGSYADQVCVSQGGSFLFTDNYDNLKIFNTQTFVLIKEFNVPNISDYTRLGVNSDGSILMVFTYDDYYEDEYYIYFFERDW